MVILKLLLLRFSQSIDLRSFQLTDLSRAVSHALRHEPWLYELELDDEGWAPVEDLLFALRQEREDWNHLAKQDLALMLKASDKQRHEIQGDKIRALYGHSIAGKLKRTPASPPDILFHGTNPDVVPQIKAKGLLPMNRQYVHLSVDTATAIAVGKRKSKTPVILHVLSHDAATEGVHFFKGNERVWLADKIPPKFIVFGEQ